MSVDISVIVVNYHCAELTARALESAAASAGRYSVEEIVVDNGSSEEERELLRSRRPKARIIDPKRNLGFAAANNLAIRSAQGRYLLLLNPDAFPQGDSVARLAEYLDSHSRVGVVAPQLVNPDGSIQDSAHKRFPNKFTLFCDFCAPLMHLVIGSRFDPHHVARKDLVGPLPIAHATGAALLVRAQAAAEAGPLDEGYFLYLEETEWQRRIAAAGWERVVLPELRCVHVMSATSGSGLGSPHYVASVLRFHRPRWLALTLITISSLISYASLRLAMGVGYRDPKAEAMASAYRSALAHIKSQWL